MKKNVVVALADKHFLDQAKQLFSTLYWNSGWSGDYALLSYDVPESDLSWFTDKGVFVKHCKPLDVASDKIGDKITACKMYLFSEYFLKWTNVVYLDVDIVTRGSIQYLADVSSFSACYSLGQTLKDNFNDLSVISSSRIEELKGRYDLTKKAFNSGVIAFPTSIITAAMFEKLLFVFKEHVHDGLFGGDQLPFNMFFYDKWSELPQAFNQITPLGDHSYDTGKLRGLVIHCVSFGEGPWDKQSIFYGEWLSNFNKADIIDLNNPPSVPLVTLKEIERRSKAVLNVYIYGGDLNSVVFFKRLFQVCVMVFTAPKQLLMKIKGLLR